MKADPKKDLEILFPKAANYVRAADALMGLAYDYIVIEAGNAANQAAENMARQVIKLQNLVEQLEAENVALSKELDVLYMKVNHRKRPVKKAAYGSMRPHSGENDHIDTTTKQLMDEAYGGKKGAKNGK